MCGLEINKCTPTFIAISFVTQEPLATVFSQDYVVSEAFRSRRCQAQGLPKGIDLGLLEAGAGSEQSAPEERDSADGARR